MIVLFVAGAVDIREAPDVGVRVQSRAQAMPTDRPPFCGEQATDVDNFVDGDLANRTGPRDAEGVKPTAYEVPTGMVRPMPRWRWRVARLGYAWCLLCTRVVAWIEDGYHHVLSRGYGPRPAIEVGHDVIPCTLELRGSGLVAPLLPGGAT